MTSSPGLCPKIGSGEIDTWRQFTEQDDKGERGTREYNQY